MSSEGMHPEDIKAAIRKRGTTLQALSLEWGFSEAAVRVALTRSVPGVEPRIAKFIGKQLHEIWPDRYDRDNFRIRHSRKTIRKKKRAVTAKNNTQN